MSTQEVLRPPKNGVDQTISVWDGEKLPEELKRSPGAGYFWFREAAMRVFIERGDRRLKRAAILLKTPWTASTRPLRMAA